MHEFYKPIYQILTDQLKARENYFATLDRILPSMKTVSQMQKRVEIQYQFREASKERYASMKEIISIVRSTKTEILSEREKKVLNYLEVYGRTAVAQSGTPGIPTNLIRMMKFCEMELAGKDTSNIHLPNCNTDDDT